MCAHERRLCPSLMTFEKANQRALYLSTVYCLLSVDSRIPYLENQ
jgi:hypothetical protein